ncbi:hypothetical protein CCH79_00004032 [Gambusia affinis]|uniref:Uncharacterized protein n=1 Tax=Gambusia affinis TaxID=33528 RepID=A0A315V5K7_GAMAF|nr:hypothetical protein CCH79_00004032 [Gambusia affinis]
MAAGKGEALLGTRIHRRRKIKVENERILHPHQRYVFTKTKEVIVDYRRSRRTEHHNLLNHGEGIERVDNIKFLASHISSYNLTWSLSTSYLVTVQQRVFFPRKL